MSKHHNDARWHTLRRQRITQAQTNSEPCCRCGQPIQYNAPYRIPNSRNRRGWGINPAYPTIDHLDPPGQGHSPYPTLDRLAPAHHQCNTRHGARLKHNTSTQQNTKGFSGVADRDPTDISGFLSQESAGWSDVWGCPQPRWLSPPHPDRAGSLGVEFIEWVEARRRADPLIPDDEKSAPGAWRLIADRALEVDARGRLCWRVVVLTVPRQSTKSSFASELMVWRIHQGERFGERQTAIHAANNLKAAHRIISELWVWAEGLGFKVGRRAGEEFIQLPDLSRWEITSLAAAYGARSPFFFGDECFDMPLALVQKAVLPTQARRKQPQTWLVSTANDDCTELMPHYMERAKRPGERRVCLIDWGIPDGADPLDRSLWPLSNPFPTPEYLAEVAEAVGQADWVGQWLNRWPPADGGKARWWIDPDVVAACGVSVVSPVPLVGGLEVGLDGVTWSAVVSDGVQAQVLPGVSGDQAVEWLCRSGVPVVLGHQAVVSQVGHRFEGVADVVAVRASDAAGAVQMLFDRVRAGGLVWDHGEVVAAQFRGAHVVGVDGGQRIVTRQSLGPVELVKCLAWVVWWCATHAPVAPAVF